MINLATQLIHMLPDWAERTLAAIGSLALIVGAVTMLITFVLGEHKT